jgi:hypothetical protein
MTFCLQVTAILLFSFAFIGTIVEYETARNREKIEDAKARGT